jgi:hypothetical protein
MRLVRIVSKQCRGLGLQVVCTVTSLSYDVHVVDVALKGIEGKHLLPAFPGQWLPGQGWVSGNFYPAAEPIDVRCILTILQHRLPTPGERVVARLVLTDNYRRQHTSPDITFEARVG